ncbi:MAG: hypothetical protein HY072_04960 [Deltaproteobacteria bacterium]|nr:hypothetical protein [Deltaproteobacteria bacterium]
MNTPQQSSHDHLTLAALRVFLFFTAIVFGCAFAYCYRTGYLFPAYLLGGGGIIIISLVFILFGKKEKYVEKQFHAQH